MPVTFILGLDFLLSPPVFLYLGLEVIAGDDVTDGAKRGRLHSGGGVDEQLHQSLADASFDHSLDLVVLAVREVAQGPAGVGQDLLVNGVDQLGEGRQRRTDVLEAGLRLPPAEVGQGPRSVAEHRQLGAVGQLLEERAHGTLLQHQVAAHRRVPCDVAQGPNLSRQEANTRWYRVRFDTCQIFSP